MPDRPLADLLRDHTKALMALPGVLGVGEGRRDGVPCIVLLVTAASPEILAALPESLEGYPVEVEAVGEIRALDA